MEEIVRKIEEELNIKSDDCVEKKNKEKILKYLNINVPIDDFCIEERIVQPFEYLITHHGKNFRQKLLLSLNYWTKAPAKVENILSKISYILHNLGLVMDDIQDLTMLRRGKPCVHLVYGMKRTMNLLYFLVGNCFEMMLTLDQPLAVNYLLDASRCLIQGQVMDVYWRENSICPTEDEYKSMVLRKTGANFILMYGVLEINSTEEIVNRPDIIRIVTNLGLYFQLNDDFINLWNVEYQKSKGFCEDITEGKFSYPIIYVINNFPEEGKIVKGILFLRAPSSLILILVAGPSPWVALSNGRTEHLREENRGSKNSGICN
ncbi:hypothetical protein ILUMI_09882 [Ignelater luminosus]|uniref:Geranylgeranyl pyrophosphate synthase n=1 Tax=Ignelater luminosus TaxID=2038154 RepID=A0A8K0GC01_IGNLU|nr:hypothetical protein ILUMI_09882 [Ignelater luminosus]